MSETFAYVFTDQTTKATDDIVVTVATPATNSTGYGAGYAVTAVEGFLGSTPITGEVGTGGKVQTDSFNQFGYDNTVFGNVNSGRSGSIDGIDYNGIEFTAGGNEYELYTYLNGFLLQVASHSTDGLTLVATDAPCFCRGTRIATPRGEVAVERLQVGDLVLTRSGASVPLTWIGRGRSLVTPANPNARPIIVRAGALADGVPVRDLHLTRGHSLLLDGVLIPVEYLINDRSIAWDHTARVVEFFHLELEHHDILLADGAEAESYREDGNRHLFHNTDLPRHATHGMAPYAPVLTGGPEVDRVWARLLARAVPAETDLTGDADLHLLADGVRVEGVSEDPMRHRFRLDRVPFDLRIGSRVCNPVRMGTGRDPRDLGVALRRLVLRGEGAELVLGWDSPWLQEGFNGPEPEAQSRWTTGSGLVPGRALAAFEGPVEVELELGMLTRYAMPVSEAEVTAAMAAVHGHTGTGG